MTKPRKIADRIAFGVIAEFFEQVHQTDNFSVLRKFALGDVAAGGWALLLQPEDVGLRVRPSTSRYKQQLIADGAAKKAEGFLQPLIGCEVRVMISSPVPLGACVGWPVGQEQWENIPRLRVLAATEAWQKMFW